MLQRLLKNSFKILLCFLIFLSVFIQPVQSMASSSDPYNHLDLLEYDGYGEAMYETIVRESVYVTGQYTDNKQYVSDSIDEIIDYSKFWINELDEFGKAKRLRDLLAIPGGALLTMGDWFKRLFSDYTESVEPPIVEDIYSTFVTKLPSTYFIVNPGYKLIFNNNIEITNGYGNFTLSFKGSWDEKNGGDVSAALNNISLSNSMHVDGDVLMSFVSPVHINSMNFTQLVSKIKSVFPVSLRIVTDDGKDVKPSVPSVPSRPNTVFNDYIQKNDKPVVVPQPKPFLVCPDGSRIQMSVTGSTFLGADGKTILVNKDGSSSVNSDVCKLGWDSPSVGYVDDRVVIQIPDGKWQDVLTGEVVGSVSDDDVESDGEKLPAVGDGGFVCTEKGNIIPCDQVEKIDGSLLAYIKNAYEYATGVIKTGVDGLKSLGTGAVELTKLYGVFFGWLPKEIVVLMTSGLAIMLGLRIFRK